MKVIIALSVLALLLIAGCTSIVPRSSTSDTSSSAPSVSTAALPSNIEQDVSNLDSLDQDLNVNDVEEFAVDVDDFESIDF